MVAQVLDPFFPGQDNQLDGHEVDATEEADVLPPEGADDAAAATQEPQEAAIEPEPPDLEPTWSGRTRSRPA